VAKFPVLVKLIEANGGIVLISAHVPGKMQFRWLVTVTAVGQFGLNTAI
jgi:hypothetical protein